MLDSEPTDPVEDTGRGQNDAPTNASTDTSASTTGALSGSTTDKASKTTASGGEERPTGPARAVPTVAPLFLAPDPSMATPPPRPADSADSSTGGPGTAPTAPADGVSGGEPEAGVDEGDGEARPARRRRRGRRGRGRGRGAQAAAAEGGDAADEADAGSAGASAPTGGDVEPSPAAPAGVAKTDVGSGPEAPTALDDSADESPDDGETVVEEKEEAADGGTVRRRRRRRRRKRAGGGGEAEAEETSEDGVVTVVRVREGRDLADEVKGVTGSTRLEAKRQRRRGGRDQRRTRPPVLSESEFLARRESVDRVMVIRELPSRTQIAVLEDGVVVEHYVSRAGSSSLTGSVYLGKVQNVLPSMEAAFVDVGRGRNAVLYAGELNWEATGLEGKSRSIEQALKPGDSVLVQVTKDPVGHKGARLSSHIALSGRHLVFVPNGTSSGISRKLPDTERRRLRAILKDLVPEGAGVIVRTAAEGASEDDLSRDIKRLQAQWDDIQAKAATSTAPALLYSEPDLVVRVVRDLFNEDFRELVIQGDDAYDTVEAYLSHVSPDLVSRLRRHTGTEDVFDTYRIEEQILKGLDRKVYLPSGGHLVIDRTEAMTVIDVNTGKYTGAGGNLEETVTRNNLEAAEEIVRQLRLRDIGGIIVIDFIDMVLESNRELVLRRLTECLGRDRTKHQVTEITSLGLVQMTRKRVGAGLLEAFSQTCDCCKGRGVVITMDPSADRPKNRQNAERVKAVAAAGNGNGNGRRRGGRTRTARAAQPAGEATGSGQPAPATPAGPEAADTGVGAAEPTAEPPSAAPRPDTDGDRSASAERTVGATASTTLAEAPDGEEVAGVGGVLRRFRLRSSLRRGRP